MAPYYQVDNLVQTGSIAGSTNITTTSGTFATILTLSITSYGGTLRMHAIICSSNNNTAIQNQFRIQLNGATINTGSVSSDGGGGGLAPGPTAQLPWSCSMFGTSTPAGGAQTITLQWATTGGTARINASTGTNGESCVLFFEEVYV